MFLKILHRRHLKRITYAETPKALSNFRNILYVEHQTHMFKFHICPHEESLPNFI